MTGGHSAAGFLGDYQSHEGCAFRDDLIYGLELISSGLWNFSGSNDIVILARDRGVFSFLDVQVSMLGAIEES